MTFTSLAPTKWFGDDDTPITLDEWVTNIESDAEMRLDGHAEQKTTVKLFSATKTLMWQCGIESVLIV